MRRINATHGVLVIRGLLFCRPFLFFSVAAHRGRLPDVR
jgi:hypothetical protein